MTTGLTLCHDVLKNGCRTSEGKTLGWVGKLGVTRRSPAGAVGAARRTIPAGSHGLSLMVEFPILRPLQHCADVRQN